MAKPGDKIFRLDPKQAGRFEDVLARTGMTQQELVRRAVAFVLEQDDLAQAMILGQINPNSDLLETILKRLVDRQQPKRAAR